MAGGLSGEQCGECGAPATSAAVDSFWRDVNNSRVREQVGPVKYGCAEHPVESFDLGEIRDPLPR